MSEPTYDAKEHAARRKEVKKLRDQAVKSWNNDKTGSVALVMMTFTEYCKLLQQTS